MTAPLQITWRNLEPSPDLQARIEDHAAKLARLAGPIMSCHVVVEVPHRRHRQGNLFHVTVDVTTPPEREFVVTRDPPQHHAHEDAAVAARDAFAAATRRLQDHARKRQGKVKRHTTGGRPPRPAPPKGQGAGGHSPRRPV